MTSPMREWRAQDVGGCGGAWDAKILKLPDSVGPYSASESSIPHPFSMIPILITPIFLPVYSTWSTGLASTSNTATPVWIYVFGGGCLVVGSGNVWLQHHACHGEQVDTHVSKPWILHGVGFRRHHPSCFDL